MDYKSMTGIADMYQAFVKSLFITEMFDYLESVYKTVVTKETDLSLPDLAELQVGDEQLVKVICT